MVRSRVRSRVEVRLGHPVKHILHAVLGGHLQGHTMWWDDTSRDRRNVVGRYQQGHSCMAAWAGAA